MIATPALSTERLTLEAITAAHAAEAWPLVDDERMWTYFPTLRPHTMTDLRRQYERWERGSADATQVWRNWLCRERSSRRAIGTMQATIVRAQGLSYIAYAIFPENQRKGYASEAVRAVIAYVRETYRVKRFVAEMHVRNEASYRLAEALGFTRVSTSGNEFRYELALQ